jgi:glycogen(starch) synthase
MLGKMPQKNSDYDSRMAPHEVETSDSGDSRLLLSVVSGSGIGLYTALLAGELVKLSPIDLISTPFAPDIRPSDDVRLLALPQVSGIKNRLWRHALVVATTYHPIRQLIRNRKRHRLVHFVNPGHWPQGLAITLAAKISGYRTILTIHDVLPHRYFLPRWLRGWEVAGIRWLYALQDRLVVHHAGAQDELRNLQPRLADKTAVIPHGIFEYSQAPRSDSPPATGPLRLLAFGHIRANKGIKESIGATQRINRDAHRVDLRVVGRPFARERFYAEDCRALVQQAPLGISFEERFVENTEIPDLIAWSDAFLLPYQDFHSQSGVATLALSNGKAILATRAGGLQALLEDLQAGIAIEGDKAEDVADAIIKALAMGRQKLEEIGAAAQSRIVERHSWPNVARLHHQLYETLAGSAQRDGG